MHSGLTRAVPNPAQLLVALSFIFRRALFRLPSIGIKQIGDGKMKFGQGVKKERNFNFIYFYKKCIDSNILLCK